MLVEKCVLNVWLIFLRDSDHRQLTGEHLMPLQQLKTSTRFVALLTSLSNFTNSNCFIAHQLPAAISSAFFTVHFILSKFCLVAVVSLYLIPK